MTSSLYQSFNTGTEYSGLALFTQRDGQKNLVDKIKQIVVGQDEAVEQLCSAMHEHYLRHQNGRTKGKNNVLLFGPAGTGKIFLCCTLARLLNIPFLCVDATQYTAPGRVDGMIDDILFKLSCEMVRLPNNTFPFSIVYIDEIDKVRLSQDGGARDINGGIQKELIKLFENSQHTSPSHRIYDISKVWFVSGGEFAGLDEIIAKRLTKCEVSTPTALSYSALLEQISMEDLMEYGFLPELLGRMAGRVVLNELDENALVRILTEGKNNVISQYKAIFKQAGIRLIVPKEVLHTIAREAITNKMGVRGLAQVLSLWLKSKLLKTKKEHKKQYTLSVNP